MDNELLQQARSVATRLELGKSDPVTLAWAEQDLRTLRSRYVADCLRTAFAAMARAGGAALTGAWSAAKGALPARSKRIDGRIASQRPL